MEYEHITSRRNPLVRAAAELASSPRARREARAFLCEGARLCRDAVLSDIQVETCFFTPQAERKYAAYLEPVLAAAERAFRVEPSVAQLLADTKSPQGIFCVCRWPGNMEGIIGFAPHSPCLVLENIQDPGIWGLCCVRQRPWAGSGCFCWGTAATPFPPRRCGPLWARCSAKACVWSPRPGGCWGCWGRWAMLSTARCPAPAPCL